jgi:hypothetical protein
MTFYVRRERRFGALVDAANGAVLHPATREEWLRSQTMPSFFAEDREYRVIDTGPPTTPGGDPLPRIGWVGPLPSRIRAEREAAAWISAGWSCEVKVSTPTVRAEIRAWQRAARAKQAAGR